MLDDQEVDRGIFYEMQHDNKCYLVVRVDDDDDDDDDVIVIYKAV
jgi:hypothetical protein